MSYGLFTRRIGADETITWEAPGIVFALIQNDARSEAIFTGRVWGPAPPWRAQRADWIRITSPAREGEIIRVVTVTKRHRVGRTGKYGQIMNGKGRFVDPGERYSCPAVRAHDRLARERHQRRLVERSPTEPLDPWLFDFLSDPALFVLS